LFLFSKFSTTTITTTTTTTITFQSFLYDANILRLALAETFFQVQHTRCGVNWRLTSHTHGSTLILFDVILGVGGKITYRREKIEKLGVELPKQLDNIARNVIIVPDIFLYFNSVSLFLFLFFCVL
jgi:hypothetical protein